MLIELAVEINRPWKERGRRIVIEPLTVKAVRWKGSREVAGVFSLMLIEPFKVFTFIVVRRELFAPPPGV